MLRASTPPAVVAADHRALAHGNEDPLLVAMGKRPVVCGSHDWSLCRKQRRRADGALGTATKSLLTSRSVSKLVGTSDFIQLDELRVRSALESNRYLYLTSNQPSVVCRDTPCASPRCLQAAQVVETKREQLERGRAIVAAAAVGERLILSHALGQQRGRHHALRGLRAACMRHAAEGWLRRRVGFQPSLPALGLGSLAQLSSWDSLEQQRRLQGALVRVAARDRRIDAVRSAGKKSRIRDSSV